MIFFASMNWLPFRKIFLLPHGFDFPNGKSFLLSFWNCVSNSEWGFASFCMEVIEIAAFAACESVWHSFLQLNPIITQCTWALIFASLSQRNVLYAKSKCIPNCSNIGFQIAATCSPCVMELVETRAAFICVPCIIWAAL